MSEPDIPRRPGPAPQRGYDAAPTTLNFGARTVTVPVRVTEELAADAILGADILEEWALFQINALERARRRGEKAGDDAAAKPWL